jgi:sugar lactone lactonase YvrE
MKSHWSKVGLIASFAVFVSPLAKAAPFTFITLAGASAAGYTNGTGSNARFNAPGQVVFDGARNAYVADRMNSVIRQVSPSGSVTLFGGTPGVTGNTNGPAGSATFERPVGLTRDTAGNLYVSDNQAHVIRKIDASGNVTTFAGTVDQAGSANGTGTAAQFNQPAGLACDASGNVFVADRGNQCIRVIAPDGTVTTIAGAPQATGSADGSGSNARFNNPNGLAVDAAGCVYVADLGNNTIRKLCPGSPGYVVFTLAGQAGSAGSVDGAGSNARFQSPSGVAVDARGNLYVADSGGYTVRFVRPGGDVTTVAGIAGTTGARDGTGTDATTGAQFTAPGWASVTSDGDVYVTDGNSIRYASNANSEANYVNFALPYAGEHIVNTLGPRTIELRRIATKPTSSGPLDSWASLVDSNGNSTLQNGDFTVQANGTTVSVASVGFRRRPLYGKAVGPRDLRVECCIYLQLSSDLYPSTTSKPPYVLLKISSSKFPEIFTTNGGDDVRFNPAIHVNEEGYLPNLAKRAVVGYYLGNLGELTIPTNDGAAQQTTTFQILNSGGGVAFTGTLSAPISPDVTDTGWNSGYLPPPYQRVLIADFSSLAAQGEYRLYIPSFGVSLPFRIDDGIAMKFLRTIELGLYHQRCGMALTAPYTEYDHDACHTAPAQIPTDSSDFSDTWAMMRDEGRNSSLTGLSSLWYPYTNQVTTVDVVGGHHDAGDFNKYTVDSALLLNNLMLTVDYMPGASSLDNLGIPESQDTIPDLLQEAKIEADYLLKLQDKGGGVDGAGHTMVAGGFYTTVYSKYTGGKYNQATLDPNYQDPNHPGAGFQQVIWPISTTATGAAVAALAQCSSSPAFRTRFPGVADNYLAAAKQGWAFLQQQIALRGYGHTYQQIHFYGHDFNDTDEIVWAACELYLATGDDQYKAFFLGSHPDGTGFDPSQRMGTYQENWDPLYEGYGNTVRSYAFAALGSGRMLPGNTYLNPGVLDQNFLTACRNRILLPPSDSPDYGTALIWRHQTAYGASMPFNAKQYFGRIAYFHSLLRATDIASMQQLSPSADNLEALVANLNYEAGTNPTNTVSIAGLGWRQQREMVSQLYRFTGHPLPPPGTTFAQMTEGYSSSNNMSATELQNLSFPADGHYDANNDYQLYNGAYPMYDRWMDLWNVNAEGVTYRQAAGLMALVTLANGTQAAGTAWKSGSATIASDADDADGTIHAVAGQPVHCSFSSSPTTDSSWRIVWQAATGDTAAGATYTYIPAATPSSQWVEVDATAPDGRRVTQRKVVSVGSTSSSGGTAPTITSQPQSQTATVGSSVSFTVGASGSAPLSYQWTKNGTAISGANSQTLSFASVQSSDAGNYAVTVSNSAGNVTSNTATLTVNTSSQLTITMTPSGNQTIAVNQSITYSINASDPSGQMDCIAFFWQDPDGHQSWDGSTGTPTGLTFGSSTGQWSNPQTSASLTVAATATRSGTFYVKAGIHEANGGWMFGTTYTLTVTASGTPPTITTQPASQTANVGSNVSFTVAANGTAPLSYQWQKNGTAISGANAATFSLSNVQTSDAGNYTVTVSNSAGSTTSNTATFTVNSAPTINLTPAGDQTIALNGSITYSISATDPSGQMDCIAFFWQDPDGHQSWDGSTGTPTGLTFGSTTGQWSNPQTSASLTVTATATRGGTFYVKAGIHQANGGWVFGPTYALVVTTGPVITMTPSGNQTIPVNQSITYSTNCSDPSGQMDCVAFFWQDPDGHQSWDGSTGTPTGLTFNQPEGVWSNPESSASRTITATATRAGTFYVKWGIHQANGGWVFGTTYELNVQ